MVLKYTKVGVAGGIVVKELDSHMTVYGLNPGPWSLKLMLHTKNPEMEENGEEIVVYPSSLEGDFSLFLSLWQSHVFYSKSISLNTK